MFDTTKDYGRVKEPGDTGRILLVQGELSVWEGWPPSEAFQTPDWAKSADEDLTVPQDLEERAAKVTNDLRGMKKNLQDANESVRDDPASEEKPVAQRTVTAAGTGHPVQRKTK